MIKEIDYITKVAELGSISKAAEQLYITPSALSKYIQTLEAKYNVKLFDRIGKKFILTHAGQRYIHWAKLQQNIIHEMETELADISNSLRGTITVGIQMGFSDFWISNVLTEFSKLYPDIKIEIIEDTSNAVLMATLNNEVDFAITEIHNTYDDLIYHHLYEENMVIAAPADDIALAKLAKNRPGHKYPWLSAEVISNQRFILPFSSQRTMEFINEMMEANNIQANTVINIKLLSTILHCISNGLGISIIPDFSVLSGESHEKIKLYSFGDKPVPRPWVLMHRKGHFLTESTETLINLTIEKYAEATK